MKKKNFPFFESIKFEIIEPNKRKFKKCDFYSSQFLSGADIVKTAAGGKKPGYVTGGMYGLGLV
jgi:hypothetical protein